MWCHWRWSRSSPPFNEYWYEVIGSPPAEPAVKATDRTESLGVRVVREGAAGRAIGVTGWSGVDERLEPAALVATTPM